MLVYIIKYLLDFSASWYMKPSTYHILQQNSTYLKSFISSAKKYFNKNYFSMLESFNFKSAKIISLEFEARIRKQRP